MKAQLPGHSYPDFITALLAACGQSSLWIMIISPSPSPDLTRLSTLRCARVTACWASARPDLDGFHGALLALQGAWPRTCYFLVSHAVSGILHVQITLSHFSMDVTEKPQYR